MKLHRIGLRDYRGVAEATVSLATTGVTVIEGPNEVGKSSLVEAIDLALSVRDSSTHRRIKAIQPRGQHVGPSVTLELSTGAYHLTVSKRWLVGQSTTLTVTRPRHEALTGREAHERLQAILEETLDRNLWDALRLDQGASLDAVACEGPTLSRALEEASDGDAAGDREDSLWDKIVEERNKFWSQATGKPVRERAKAAQEVDAAKGHLAAVQASVATKEARAERLAALTSEAVALDRGAIEAEAALALARDRLAGIATHRDQVSHRSTRLAAAEAELRSAIEAVEHRRHMTDAAERATAQVAATEPEEAAAIAKASAAADATAAASEAADAAEAALAAAGERTARAETSVRNRRRRIELVEVMSAASSIALLDEQTQACAAVVESSIDEATLEEIERADLALARARAVADAGAATVVATSEADTTITIDGETNHLGAGAELSRAVSGELVVTVGTVRLSFNAGTQSRESADLAAQAAEALDARLAAASVGSVAEARGEATRRREAERSIAELHAQRTQVLAGRSAEELDRQRTALVAELVDDHTDGALQPDPAVALGEAETELAEARAAVTAAEQAAGRCRRALQQAAGTQSGAAMAAARAEERLVQHRQLAGVAEAALQAARSDASDASLDARSDEARAALDRASSELAEAQAVLAALHPDEIERSVAAAEASLDQAAKAVAANRDLQVELRTLVEADDKRGLGKMLSDAETYLQVALEEHRSVEKQAVAAQLLYETFARHREAARDAYVGPLRDRITELGRRVFGPDFEVELSPDLSISNRTLGGTTVGFADLSGGAREQIGLLTRLAVAGFVSGDGAPVVIDDALGWSDPDRAAAMARLIEAAGTDCQVIVLTCSPERYRALTPAVTVSLPAEAEVVEAEDGEPDGPALANAG